MKYRHIVDYDNTKQFFSFSNGPDLTKFHSIVLQVSSTFLKFWFQNKRKMVKISEFFQIYDHSVDYY